MSIQTCCEIMLAVPCQVGNPDLWFAEDPRDLARAKAQCAQCPIRPECLAGALKRREPWGVWGGEILESGAIVACKLPRGRPRKKTVESPMVNAVARFRISAATLGGAPYQRRTVAAELISPCVHQTGERT